MEDALMPKKDSELTDDELIDSISKGMDDDE